MRLLPENMVPVVFFALWVAVAGYAVYSTRGQEVRGEPVAATIELTVNPGLAATPQDDQR